MPRSWSSDGMVTKPHGKAKTVSCAWCGDHGPPESTIRNFGMPSYARRSASIRPQRDSMSHLLSRKTELLLQGEAKLVLWGVLATGWWYVLGISIEVWVKRFSRKKKNT